jgi:hypothetical protein
MSAPSYRWLCHRCGSPNEPHIEKCISCGFSAVASADEIARSLPDYQPPHWRAARAGLSKHRKIFFPAIIFAAAIVLVTPFWSIRLASTGHMALASVLVVGVGLAVYTFSQFMRRGHTYSAYYVMIAMLLLSLAVLVNA